MDGLNETQVVLSTISGSPLDSFELFYEELISSKPQNRIRRVRVASASKR
ncbi:MAG TPA: hypothetical protein VG992_01100 [Candidatus Saccharimonadales bacterium]|nr:hypothetical protein [Candidatus Saccharimonadales bacterium]